jgi:septal ring factor EnvC (AmiA/AmiB activator)
LGWLLALSLSLSPGAGAETQAPAAADPVLESRQGDLVEIEQQVEAVGAELIGHHTERQALVAELEERERDVAALALANRELEGMIRDQTRTAEELRTREAEDRAALEDELVRLAELLRAAYAMGRADALRMLLNQEDPVAASRVMSYFAYFNRERVGRIEAVQTRVLPLAELARDAARLAELAAQQETTRARLATARAERAQVLAGLERTIRSREDDMAGLRRDAENLKLLVERLRQRAQIQAELAIGRDPFPSRRGRLDWPLLERRVLAAFGTPKETSGLAWDGVLLAAREGEEVRAVWDGRVVYADWLRGFGLLLAIDHGDGYLSFYGHNEALLKEVGEWVGAGEPVALSGRSGGRAAPVLYFAIRRQGEPLDPALWCG